MEVVCILLFICMSPAIFTYSRREKNIRNINEARVKPAYCHYKMSLRPLRLIQSVMSVAPPARQCQCIMEGHDDEFFQDAFLLVVTHHAGNMPSLTLFIWWESLPQMIQVKYPTVGAVN